MAKAKRSTRSSEPSSVIQLGVVFIIVSAMVLLAVAATMYTPK